MISIQARRPAWSARMDLRPGLPARTLALIRWTAVAGQLTAVVMTYFALGYNLPIVPCLAVVAGLALSNLMLYVRPVGQGRLDDAAAARFMGFDVVEVSALSFLTGGLSNPFTFLLLAPVTVSATALSRRSTLALAALALFCITFLAFFHLPLPWNDPAGIELPETYQLAVWTALSVAVVFIASYVWSVVAEARRVADALSASEAALAREQELSALDGLAAAAAHELGSPLATIAIVAKELKDQLAPDSVLMEDVDLLISQSDRCRDILAGLARRPEEARGAAEITRAPLIGLLQEAAENHVPDGVGLNVKVDDTASGPEPVAPRSPEILQGLGNFIQNAGQFARAEVTLTAGWDETRVWIRVRDDGPGFPGWMLASLGEPYLSSRGGDGEHMGLGVFIATTLLQRTGARVSFQNRSGAEVVISWRRAAIDLGDQDDPTARRRKPMNG